MTPLLIFAGVPEKIAIGTDLLYAALTKTGAMWSHNKLGTIHWRIVLLLASGSIPGAILTSYYLKVLEQKGIDYSQYLTTALGAMLVVTGSVLFAKNHLQKTRSTYCSLKPNVFQRNNAKITVFSGFILGTFVTLSSVGAGAFCVVLLLSLYPRMIPINVVGTDIAHAVPLTLVAGLGHWVLLDSVDLNLLVGLLIGSLPAVHFGAKVASKLPAHRLQTLLATILLLIGGKFLLF